MSEIIVLFFPVTTRNLKTVIVKTCLFLFSNQIYFSWLDKMFSTIGNTYNPSFFFLKSYKRKQKPKKTKTKPNKHHRVGLCSEVETVHLKAVHRPLLRSHDIKIWIHLTQTNQYDKKSTWSLSLQANAQSKFWIKFVTWFFFLT